MDFWCSVGMVRIAMGSNVERCCQGSIIDTTGIRVRVVKKPPLLVGWSDVRFSLLVVGRVAPERLRTRA